MKQVQQNYRTGELGVVEVPEPAVRSGTLLVATNVSLISAGTEKQLMDLAKASLAGKAIARPDLVRRVVREARKTGVSATVRKVLTKLDTPIPLGYSLAGSVVEVGRDVSGFAVGDRVACAGAGFANHAEYNAVPKNLIVPIPDCVDDEQASFVTLGSIALQGVRQAAPTLGETVVVIGLGLIGLLTVQLLKANGCRVLGFDPNAERAALARALGADQVVSDGLTAATSGFTGGIGADAVIVAASSKSSDPLNTAAEISRLKGRIVVVGLVGMTIDREPFYKRELDLRLSMSYGPGRHDPSYEIDGHDYPLPYVRWTEQRNMAAFLGLVADGKVTPSRLVTHRFPIADASQAYQVMESDEPHLAMLLTCEERPKSAPLQLIERGPSIAPSTMRIAFLGLGNYAQSMLLPCLRKMPDVSLAGLATATGISASHSGETYGFATVSTDPDAIIEKSDIDAIFIVTRHDTHASLAASALRAGKHVFCEKPLALNDDELTDVIAATEGSPGTILTVGFNRRFAPLLVEAHSLLANRSSPLVMVYRINAGAIPADNWVQRGEGGGRVLGEVCHFVDTLTWLCGALPVEVSAASARGHRDTLSTIIRFSDGSIGTIIYSALGDNAGGKEYLEVFADGTIIQMDDFSRLTITRSGKKTVRKAKVNKGQAGLVAAFVNAVRRGDPAPIPLCDLVSVTEATFAIEDALRTGAVVALDRD